MEGRIQLRYPGFVVFASRLFSVMTGMAFVLMLTRSTTEAQFGIWLNVNDVLAYLTIASAIVPFWSMRFIARGLEGAAKTGLVVNAIASALIALIYLPLVPAITSALNVKADYVALYFLSSVLMIEAYVIAASEACLRARRPQAIGYGLIVAEVCKVALGLALIVGLRWGLFGAMLSLIVTFAAQVSYYFSLMADELKRTVRWYYAKEWLKGSIANVYNIVGDRIAAFIFIMLFVLGSEAARGYYGAASAIASVITYSSLLAFALYPRLLAEGRLEDVTTSFNTVLTFAMPMTIGAMIMADSYTFILRDVYLEARSVLRILAIDAFVIVLSQFFSSVLLGVERLDERVRISLKELVRSKLFFAFSLPYVHSVIALPIAYYALSNLAGGHPLQAASYVALINAAARLITFMALFAAVRKSVAVSVQWTDIAKRAFASTTMGAFLLVIPRPMKVMPVLGVTLAAGAVYLGILAAIDRETRSWAASIYRTLRGGNELKAL